jgi:uncharacterized protein YkwD
VLGRLGRLEQEDKGIIMRFQLTSSNYTLRLVSSLSLLFAAIWLTLPGGAAYAQTPSKDAGGHIAPLEPGQAGGSQPNTSNCTMNFSDVHTSDYFYEGVQYLYCGGAISGYSDGTFRPGNLATRGQVAKIIVLAKGWGLVYPSTPSFSDVAPGSVYFPYVETAKAHGVIGGYSDGSFHTNDNVSRGQLAKIVALAQGWALSNPITPSFTDVPPGSAFYTYVETAADKNVISGYSDGSFRPGSLATRGQISKIVYYAVSGVTPPSSGFQLTPQEQGTVDLINQRRAAMGLPALRVDPALTAAARRHSNDIGPAGLCQHNGTDGSSPWDRIAQAGYTGFGSGEVVGCGYSTAQGVVDGWWNSPGHFAILTGAAINDIGCGWWLNSQGYGWQTCDVGTSAR